MKFPAVILPWLAVPLAAGAGFYGGRRHRAETAAAHATATPGRGSGGFSGSNSKSGSGPAAAAGRGGPPAPGLVADWTARLTQCGAAELPGIFAEIQALTDPDGKRTALRLLCARWAELDAPGGLVFFRKVRDEQGEQAGPDKSKEQDQSRLWLLTEWALLDPAAACAAILEAGGQEKSGQAQARQELDKVGGALLREDPEKFRTWFRKAGRPLPPLTGSDPAWNQLAAARFEELSALGVRMLAELDPGEAGKWPRQELSGIYRLLGASLAEKDWDAALSWIRRQPESMRAAALDGALSAMAGRSPETLADLLQLRNDKELLGTSQGTFPPGDVVSKAVDRMASRDPLAALDWLRAHGPALGIQNSDVMNRLSQKLSDAVGSGKVAPEAVFAALRPINALVDVGGGVRMFVQSSYWNAASPGQLAAAAEKVLRMGDKKDQQAALQQMYPAWLARDREGALNFAAGLKDPELRSALFSGQQRSLTMTSGENWGTAMAAFYTQVPADLRAELIAGGSAGPPRSPREPALWYEGGAMAAALEGLPAGEPASRAAAKVAGNWGRMDPEAALDWARQRPDAQQREQATGAAVESWAKEDAWGASQWIDALPAGEERDVAAHHLARSLRDKDPESAWTWAGNIADPVTRVEAQAAVLRKWRDSSPPEAEAAFAGMAASLPEADRQRLMDTLHHRDAAK